LILLFGLQLAGMAMVEESVPNSQRIFFNEQFSVVANDQKNDKTKSTIVGFRCLLRPLLSFNAACSPQIDAFLESNPQALFEIWGCLGVTSFQLSFVVVVFLCGFKTLQVERLHRQC
jgi:hypothetical protein